MSNRIKNCKRHSQIGEPTLRKNCVMKAIYLTLILFIQPNYDPFVPNDVVCCKQCTFYN